MVKWYALVCIIFSMPFSFYALTDTEAIQYCATHPKSLMILFWPVAEAIESIELLEHEIFKSFDVIHKKEFSLINDGPLMLVRQVYARQEKRTGDWDDNFQGARNKMNMSFLAGTKVRAYLIDNADHEVVKTFKKELRKKYRYNFVHVNDIHEETVSMAQIVFSDATIAFFNSCKIHRCKNFEKLFKHYKEFLATHAIDRGNCCIVGDAVEAVYGIRDCNTLDFLQKHTISLESKPEKSNFDFHCYFYYLDEKFACPSTLEKAGT